MIEKIPPGPGTARSSEAGESQAPAAEPSRLPAKPGATAPLRLVVDNRPPKGEEAGLEHWMAGLAGEPQARREIERELYREVRGAVLRQRNLALEQGSGLEHDITQLTHEVLINVISRLEEGRFESLAQLHAFLREAIHCRGLNLIRRRYTFRARTFAPTREEEEEDRSLDALRSSVPTPEGQALAVDLGRRFQEAARSMLTTKEWQIWQLHTDEGLAPAEIDARLGLSQGHASVRLSQMRSGKLRSVLEKLRSGKDIP